MCSLYTVEGAVSCVGLVYFLLALVVVMVLWQCACELLVVVVADIEVEVVVVVVGGWVGGWWWWWWWWWWCFFGIVKESWSFRKLSASFLECMVVQSFGTIFEVFKLWWARQSATNVRLFWQWRFNRGWLQRRRSPRSSGVPAPSVAFWVMPPRWKVISTQLCWLNPRSSSKPTNSSLGCMGDS